MHSEHHENEEISKWNIVCLVVGVILFLITLIIPLPEMAKMTLSIVAYVLVLARVGKLAFIKTFKQRELDENTLIVISAIGAFLVGQVSEGLMVVVLYEIGEILEDKAVDGSRKSIQDLMDIRPDYANLKLDDGLKKVEPTAVHIGDTIVIKAGEKIPLDGTIKSGSAKIDNSSLTGESKYVSVATGEEVLAGSVNVDGFIEVEVTKEYKDSTVSRILDLVENATDRKAKTETTVSRIAKIYTPIVLILACLVAILLPIVSSLTYRESIYRALIFLVISCPCAIAISVPLTYFSGIGRASKSGILVKGSDYLDGLKDVKHIVFDKTGTLTTGSFQVVNVESFFEQYSEKEILKIAAIGEKNSNHPIAKSIVSKCQEKIEACEAKDYREIIGKGIAFEWNNDNIFVGSGDEKVDDGVTTINVMINETLVGKIRLEDALKEDVIETIHHLKRKNIEVSMFTGDQRDVAERVGKEIGIEDVNYEMLPDAKYQKLEEYLNLGKKVAFVGDGINDSPVLMRSDIGIAMGGIGASSSIEAADVVIMTDELSKIPEAIQISKDTNKIICENLVFALGVKILFLLLSVLGVATMWMAVFADVGVTLITILNSIRNLKHGAR
ncbi:MAG: cadmium-translocating P-type ATPase [Clostridia bacterium]|nr:cadmium-translocating P-type ATPase [Clostridia bacterium]